HAGTSPHVRERASVVAAPVHAVHVDHPRVRGRSFVRARRGAALVVERSPSGPVLLLPTLTAHRGAARRGEPRRLTTNGPHAGRWLTGQRGRRAPRSAGAQGSWTDSYP